MDDRERPELGARATHHLEQLLRLDTTNPPGNERLVAEYVADALRAAGLEPVVVGRELGRDNVVARLSGSGGGGGPLMLASHADVVPCEPERWTHPPFAAERAEGCLWGRGALDIKDATAMHLAVVEDLVGRGVPLKRDLVVSVVADEEAGMEAGSRFLVAEHPELVRAELVLGEFGGFTMTAMGLRVMPVQVAEKGLCWLRATAKGTPGHGSMPRDDNAVVALAEGIARIGRRRLPVHLSRPVRAYLERLVAALPGPKAAQVRLLQNERTAGPVLDHLVKDPAIRGPMIAMMTNTASPTTLRAGDKVNVIPAEASAELDGRTLPGQGPGDLVAELRRVAPGLDFEVIRAEPSVDSPVASPALASIERVVARHLPGVPVVPYLVPGYTDAKSWSRLGAHCYGFVPLPLPEGFPRFFDLVHGHDERVPIESLEGGTRILRDVVVDLAG